MLNRRQILWRYVVFAILATACNLGTQWLWLQLVHIGPRLLGAMAAGTATGLLCKYLLDKRFIFLESHTSAAHSSRQFLLYSLMGVATTVVFWGSEWLAHSLIAAAYAKYLGACLGLAIGYWCKYQLDKRFVFA